MNRGILARWTSKCVRRKQEKEPWRRHVYTTKEIRDEQLHNEPAFRTYWERTALARAVALAIIGYRAEHRLTQTRLAQKLGVRQPHVARLEMGEHNPSVEMLQRLAQALGLRFI